MKLQFFGREAEIKTEVAVAAVSALALLGMLIGYLFFSDNGEIIIETSGGAARQATGAGNGSVREGDPAGSGADAGKNGGYDPEQYRDSGAGGDTGTGNNTGSGNVQAMGGEGDGGVNNDPGAEKIKVYVVGCVKKPGIVTLDKGTLICDAVEMAGGLTEEADADNINMVYSLNENVMLYIKSKQDSSGIGNGAAVYGDSGPAAAVMGDGSYAAAKEGRNALVNINTAGIDELDTLPGIGEATARDIIAFREKNGGFETIEDIMKVPRIKENRFESIKDFITVK